MHVVDDNFHIPVDGILGREFLKAYECIFDYSEMKLTMKLPNANIFIPIHEGPSDNDTILPPLCESIVKINAIISQNPNDTYLFDAQVLKPGIFSARCITTANNPYVGILITTTKYEKISKNFSHAVPINIIPDTNNEPDLDEFYALKL